jgi:hypothetical protein
LSGENYLVHVKIENIGTSPETIDSSAVSYNRIPASSYGSFAPTASFITLSLNPGGSTV